MPVSHRPEPSQDRRVSVTVVTIADLVKLARRTRTFITDPAKLWTVRYDPERDVLQGVRFHAPDAIDYFGAPAVLAAALTTGTVCHWCQAFARAATAGKRLPTNEAMLELLGRPCDGCAPVIFRHIIDGLETAMAAPFDAPYPGSVDAGRPPGRQGPGVRPPIHHRPPLHDLRTQLLPAAALAGGGHPMSPDLSGRIFGRMTVIGSASEDVVLPGSPVAGGLAAASAAAR
jgi:hypothetical protein